MTLVQSEELKALIRLSNHLKGAGHNSMTRVQSEELEALKRKQQGESGATPKVPDAGKSTSLASSEAKGRTGEWKIRQLWPVVS